MAIVLVHVAALVAYSGYKALVPYVPPEITPLKAPLMKELPEYDRTYKDNMLWGSYRSGLYFGMRTRLVSSSCSSDMANPATANDWAHLCSYFTAHQLELTSTFREQQHNMMSRSYCAHAHTHRHTHTHAQIGRTVVCACRTARPLLLGLMWFDPSDPATIQQQAIRHEAQQGDKLASYGWVRHDGRSYGRQEITDGDYQLSVQMVSNNPAGLAAAAWWCDGMGCTAAGAVVRCSVVPPHSS